MVETKNRNTSANICKVKSTNAVQKTQLQTGSKKKNKKGKIHITKITLGQNRVN